MDRLEQAAREGHPLQVDQVQAMHTAAESDLKGGGIYAYMLWFGTHCISVKGTAYHLLQMYDLIIVDTYVDEPVPHTTPRTRPDMPGRFAY